jgi:hypothetical protein
MDTCNEYLIISLIITGVTILSSSCLVCYYKKKLNEGKDTYTEFYNNHTFQI